MKPGLDKKLGSYIRKHLDRGHSKEAIAKVLLNHGYDEKYVKQLLTKHTQPHPALNLLPVIAIFLIMFGFAWFVFQPGIVSYVTVEQTTAYNQTVSYSVDRTTERTWLPEHVGPLTSIALTGSISTSGTAKIYLEYNNLTYLIFNSAMLNASNSNLITGYVTLENLTAETNETPNDEDSANAQSDNQTTSNEDLINAQSNNESEELNESSDNENINQSESIAQTQPVNESVEPISKSININLIYKSGSAWDTNDDGKEPLDGVIDFTVNNSELIGINEQNLCTKWIVKSLETLSEQNICNGNENCCNFLNLNALGTEWNEPFLLTYQKYNSTENNEISAQIIYYNVNLTSLEAEIVNSEKATLSAKFKSDIIEFTNACHENCLLNNLNSTSYNLIFEVDNAQVDIGTIKYSILEKFIVNETLEENLTNVLEEKTIQYQAVINKPVKWKKTVKLNETQSNITIELPKEATNINVTKKVENESIEIENVRVKTKDYETSVNIYNAITGNVAVTIDSDSFLSKLLSSFRGITGYAVLEPSNATELLIEEAVKDIEIEYETEAPKAIEQNITENKKRITITSNVHYTNILTFTELPKEATAEAVKLYWLINNSRIEVNIGKYDTNENNLVDYIEWVTPYLSNQTYELEITVLDVQSYPTVGSTWTVRFNTTGASNLTISAVADTTYSEMFDDNALTEDDLELKELKCGDEIIFNKDALNSTDNLYFILENGNKVKLYETYAQSLPIKSIFVENYNCSDLGYHTVRVLTSGIHKQEFDFGGQKANASNEAFYLNATTPSFNFSLGTLWQAKTDGENVTLNYNFGDGSNGSLEVTSQNTIVNYYTHLTLNASSGSSEITVQSGTNFSNGDEILIVQMQDGKFYGTVGAYEYKEVSSGGGTTTLTLSSTLTNSYFTGEFDKTNTSVTQIVRVPNYVDVNITTSGSVTSKAWDGYSGGLVVFRATGLVNITGSINVTEKGFRGAVSGGNAPESYLGINTTLEGGGGGGGGSANINANVGKGGNAAGPGGNTTGANATDASRGGGAGGINGGAGGNAYLGTGGAGGAGGGSGGGGGGAGANGAGGGGGAAADTTTEDPGTSTAGAGSTGGRGIDESGSKAGGEGGTSTGYWGGGGGGGGVTAGYASGGGGGGRAFNSTPSTTPNSFNIITLGSGSSSGAGGGGGGLCGKSAGGGGGGGSANGTGGHAGTSAFSCTVAPTAGSSGNSGAVGTGTILLFTNELSMNGSIVSKGSAGGSGGAGGAGGTGEYEGGDGGGGSGGWGSPGGLVYLVGNSLDIGTNNINVSGGKGGSGGSSGSCASCLNGAAGAGGGNGTSGKIRLEYATLTGSVTGSIDAALSGYYSSGNFTSQALDANKSVKWESISWGNITSSGTNISMEYRTSNNNVAWTSYLEAFNGQTSLNSSARYFRFRANLSTTDITSTPYLMWVNITYSILPFNYSRFNGSTTDFGNSPDIKNVSNPIIEVLPYGKIAWLKNINANNSDFDSYISIGRNYIYLDSSRFNETINSSANLTMYDVGYFVSPRIFKDGAQCADCIILFGYNGSQISFNVSSFSNYTIANGTINITSALSGNEVAISASMYVSGHINLSNGTNVTGNSISVYVNSNLVENALSFYTTDDSALYNWSAGNFSNTSTDTENITLKIRPDLPAEPDTLLLFHFNQSSGNATDSSGNNNNVFFTGSYISYVQNNRTWLGNAMQAPGLDSVQNGIVANVTFNQSDDFTIEYLINITNSSGSLYHLDTRNDGNANGIIVYGTTSLNVYILDALQCNAVGTLTTNKWAYIAITKQGKSLKAYIDGSRVCNTPLSSNDPGKTINLTLLRRYAQGWNPLGGQMDEFRITQGRSLPAHEITNNYKHLMNTTRYYYYKEGNYTSQVFDANSQVSWTSISWQKTALSGIDNYTQLLIHADGAQGSTTFTDSSNYARTIGVYGNTNKETTMKKLGNASGYFDGTGDYLNITNATAWKWMNSNWTIEAWIRTKDTSTAFQAIVDSEAYNTAGYDGTWEMRLDASGGTSNFRWLGRNDTAETGTIICSYAFQNNSWYHLAAVRSNTTVYLFVDGGLCSSGAFDDPVGVDVNDIYIGGSPLGAGYFKGYIDEVRISNTSRWTANFTVPTSSYPANANVSMQYRTSNDSSTWADFIAINNSQSPNVTARYFQYMAALGTDDTDLTPYLESVNITYLSTGETDSLANYNVSFTAPSSLGNYEVNVTTTYLGLTNLSTVILTVGQAGAAPATYATFNGSTTVFNSVADIQNVTTAVLEIQPYGRLVWINYTNASNVDFDANVHIGQNYIFVNASGLNQNQNSSANLTFYDVGYFVSPRIFKDGSQCADCYVIGYNGSHVVFNVSSFSNYTIANGTLTIISVLSANRVAVSSSVYVSGHVNLSNGTNVTNNPVYLYLDNNTIHGILIKNLRNFTITDNASTLYNWSAGNFTQTVSDGENVTLEPNELPDNRTIVTQSTGRILNMTNNTLLYHLNNNSILDSSGNRIHGNKTGGLDCTGDQGKLRNGCTFDGTDDYINTNKTLVNFMNAKNTTMMLWVKPTGASPTLTNGYDGQIIADIGGYATIGRGTKGGLDAIYFGGYCGADKFTSVPYTNNEWTHITWVHNETNLTAYKNGTRINATICGSGIATTYTLRIGISWDNGLKFNGNIDEVAIWNRILTDQEILDIYNAQKDGYYHTSGNYTSQVFDASGVTSWDNITWGEVAPEGELPDNQNVLISSTGRVLNMTDNLLLLHLNNNDSSDTSGNNRTVKFLGGMDCTADEGKLKDGCRITRENNGFINITNSSGMLGLSNLSISAWIWNGGTEGQSGRIIQQFGAQTNDVMLWFQSDDKLYFQIGGAGTQVQSTTALPLREWHHVAGTFDNTSALRLYIDGILNATDATIANMPSNSGYWCLGAYCGDPADITYRLNGSVDEVAVWNRSLLAQEISDIYNAQKDGYGSDISMQYRTSNDTSAWSPFIGIDRGQYLNATARYFQFQANFTTNDTDYTPYLEWVNISYGVQTDSLANFNVSFTAPSSLGTYDVNVTSTYLGLTNTSTQQLKVVQELILPFFYNANINNSNPKFNDVVQINITAADDTALSMVIFAWNNTGVWLNISNTTSESVTALNYSVNNTVTAVKDTVVGYQFYANDSSDNWNYSVINTFTVANTPAPVATIVYPTNDFKTSRQPLDLNVTFDADIDGDVINITYYINGVLNQTSLTNTTLNASDGIYILNVSLHDNVTPLVYSANVTINFTIDLTPPNVSFNAPANNTVGSETIVFNWTASDNIDTSIDCYPTIDNNLNVSVQSTNGSYANATVIVSGGNHTIKVTCFDDGNNSNTTEERKYTAALINITVPAHDAILRPFENISINVTITAGSDWITNVTVIVFNETFTTEEFSATLYNFTYTALNITPRRINVTAYAYNNITGPSLNVTSQIQLRIARPAGTTSAPEISYACSNETYTLNTTNITIATIADIDTLLEQYNVTIILPNDESELPSQLLNITDSDFTMHFNYSYVTSLEGAYKIITTVKDIENQTLTLNKTFTVSNSTRQVNITKTGITNLTFKDICTGAIIIPGYDTAIVPNISYYDADLIATSAISHVFRNISLSSTENNTMNYTTRTNQTDPPTGKRRVHLWDMTSNMNFTNTTLSYNYSSLEHTLTHESNLDIYRCTDLSNCELVKQNITLNSTANVITSTITSLSRYMLTEPALGAISGQLQVPAIKFINFSRTYTAINEPINITVLFNVSFVLDSITLTVNSTSLTAISTNLTNNTYRYVYNYSPATVGPYVVDVIVSDENTFNANKSAVFYATNDQSISIQAVGANNMTLKDVTSNEAIASGTTIAETLPYGKYDVLVKANKTDITLLNASINDSVSIVLTFNDLPETITAPGNRTNLDQFEVNSSLGFASVQFVYNYTNISPSITDEDNLEAHKCNSVSNCTFAEVDSTVDTSANTITFTVTNLSVFDIVESIATQTVTVTTTTTTTTATGSGGGGGGGTTTTQVILLELKSSGPIETVTENLIETTIAVINKGKGTLQEINLEVESDSSSIGPSLDSYFIESLQPGETQYVTLSVLTSQDVGKYKVTTTAHSTYPDVEATLDTYIDVLEKDYINRTVIINRIQFAEDLFKENPECLELKEVFTLAEKYMGLGQYQRALETIEQAVSACRDLIAGKEEFLAPGIRKNDMALFIIEMSAIVSLMLMMYYYYKRRIAS